jgi:thiopeptide-type bacteriocin biosynthesis protein
MRNFEIINHCIKREPLLELHNYKRIPSLKEDLDLFVDELFEDALFKEAIFISSPQLYFEWEKATKGKERSNLNKAILKFFIRAISNTVPFGLFSTYSCDDKTCENHYTRFTTLDMQLLTEIVTALNSNSTVKAILRYRKNDTIYLSAEKYRYIESKNVNSILTYSMCSIDFNEVIEFLLTKIETDLSFSELTDLIINNVEGVEKETAENFISDLIQSNFLVSSLEICINEKNCFEQIITFFVTNWKALKEDSSLVHFFEILNSLNNDLSQIDRSVVNDLEFYKRTFLKLKQLNIHFEEKLVFNSNLRKSWKSVNDKNLGENVAQLIDVLKILSRESVKATSYNLEQFKSRFYKRYDEGEINFLEVFDNELGLGYLPEFNENALFLPLIDDVYAAEIGSDVINQRVEKDVFNFWLNLIVNHKGKHEVDISKENLSVYKETVDNDLGTYPILFNYVDGKVFLKFAGGTSALNLIGRFSNSDKEIQTIIDDVIGIEKNIFEEKLIPEVIHLTNNRYGNLLIRNIKRKHEISIISKRSTQSEGLDLSDLTVSLKNNKFVLKSKKHNKEVLPFITSSQNYHFDSLPHYQFLCDLQSQSRNNSFVINTGGLDLGGFDFVPRIKFGDDIILMKARWNLRKDKLLRQFPNKDNVDFDMFECIRKELSIPKYVFLTQSEEEKMIIDTENINTVPILLEELNKKEFVVLSECIYNLDGVCDFANEHIYFIKSNNRPHNGHISKQTEGVKQSFVFGEKWIYLKLYTGFVTADEILSVQISSIVNELHEKDLIEKWFFIRYTDPDFHIRFRIETKDISLIDEILRIVNHYLSGLLKENKIWKLEYGKYNRELERYLPNNIENSESIFHADSDLCITIIKERKLTNSEPKTWLYALKSVDEFFNSFGVDISKKHELISIMFENFWVEHGSNKAIKKLIEKKFRFFDGEIAEIIQNKSLDFFIQRDGQIRQLTFGSLNTDDIHNLLFSYIHMTVNRLMKSKARLHELVIYGLLQKYYKKTIGISKYESQRENEICKTI